MSWLKQELLIIKFLKNIQKICSRQPCCCWWLSIHSFSTTRILNHCSDLTAKQVYHTDTFKEKHNVDQMQIQKKKKRNCIWKLLPEKSISQNGLKTPLNDAEIFQNITVWFLERDYQDRLNKILNHFFITGRSYHLVFWSRWLLSDLDGKRKKTWNSLYQKEVNIWSNLLCLIQPPFSTLSWFRSS